MSKHNSTPKQGKRFFVSSNSTFVVCILAVAALSIAAPSTFSAEGDKDYEKGDFAWEQGDKDAAELFFAKAAEKGHAEAATRLGVIKHNGKKYEEAFKLFKQAVEQGFEPAFENLAIYYSEGLGCEANPEEAFELYLQLAKKGNIKAQSIVGVDYFMGKGVDQDDDEAVVWFRKAALQGEASAQRNLGECYQWGRGVPKDEKTALDWFTKAAEHNDEEAIYQIGNCYFYGLGTDKNLKEARNHYIKAKKWMLQRAAKDPEIGFTLGTCLLPLTMEAKIGLPNLYRDINSIKKKEELSKSDRTRLANYEELAAMWESQDFSADVINAFTFAAEKDHSNAQYALAKLIQISLFQTGKKEETDAVKWYTKAADNGNVHAQYDLADYYQGTKQEQIAEHWYRKAADNGVIAAQWKFACDAKNEKDAFFWTKKVADHSLSDLRKEYVRFYELFWPYGGELSERDHYLSAYYRMIDECYILIQAQYKLGDAYANGKSVEEDEVEAVKWFKLVAESSLEEATRNRDMALKTKQAIDNAQYTLGMYYEKGWGVEKDIVEAINWYERLMNQDDIDSSLKSKAEKGLNRIVLEMEKESEKTPAETIRHPQAITSLYVSTISQQRFPGLEFVGLDRTKPDKKDWMVTFKVVRNDRNRSEFFHINDSFSDNNNKYSIVDIGIEEKTNEPIVYLQRNGKNERIPCYFNQPIYNPELQVEFFDPISNKTINTSVGSVFALGTAQTGIERYRVVSANQITKNVVVESVDKENTPESFTVQPKPVSDNASK